MAQKVMKLVGQTPAIESVRRDIAAAAASSAKVLIAGETGAGKEVVARSIHDQSSRSQAPFVAINCAGVPETLLESEFFGHERGSFTGAYRDRAGLLAAANGGTVFLDEIVEMSPRLQALLLRFLETGEIQRVGGARPEHRADVRLVVATNRDLKEAVETKQFREDLFYRLNVIYIHVPPLRERIDDVPILAAHFLRAFAEQYGLQELRLSEEAVARLVDYTWPGNVRELKNVIERTIVRTRAGVITPADLPVDVAPMSAKPPPAPPGVKSVAAVMFDQMVKERQSFWSTVYQPFMAHDMTRDDLRQLIARGLEQTSGSYKVLARLYNIEDASYKRFLNFLRKHQCHLPFQTFRRPAAKVGVSPLPISAGPASAFNRH